MKWLYPIIASILAFIVSYMLVPITQSIVGNLATDTLKNWRSIRSLKSNRKRMAELQAEFDTITKLYKDRHAQYLELFHLLFINIMVASGIVAIIVATFVLPYFIRQVLFSVAVGLFLGLARDDFYTVKMIACLQDYDEYKRKTENVFGKFIWFLRECDVHMRRCSAYAGSLVRALNSIRLTYWMIPSFMQ